MDALSSTLDRSKTGAVGESTGKPPIPPKPDWLKNITAGSQSGKPPVPPPTHTVQDTTSGTGPTRSAPAPPFQLRRPAPAPPFQPSRPAPPPPFRPRRPAPPPPTRPTDTKQGSQIRADYYEQGYKSRFGYDADLPSAGPHATGVQNISRPPSPGGGIPGKANQVQLDDMVKIGLFEKSGEFKGGINQPTVSSRFGYNANLPPAGPGQTVAGAAAWQPPAYMQQPTRSLILSPQSNVASAQGYFALGHQQTPSDGSTTTTHTSDYSGGQRTPFGGSVSDWSDNSGTPNVVAAGGSGQQHSAIGAATTGQVPDTTPSSGSKQVNCVSVLMKKYNNLTPVQKVLFYICVGLIIGSVATVIAVAVQYG